MSSVISVQSPFVKRFQAWAAERFPIVNVITGIVMYLMALAVGRATTYQGSIPIFGWDALGAVALICQFLLLRVLDEHKDYELDLVNYPQRALQRGLITLDHLKVVGVFSALIELGVSFFRDEKIGSATWSWALMTAWTLLMAKEFFCGEWLKKRLLLYAVSHMLIMPFTMVWILKIVDPSVDLQGSPLTLIVLTLISGFAFEIARKMRGAEEERETLDSYSKVLGNWGSAFLLIVFLVAIAGTEFTLIFQLGARPFLVGRNIIALMCALSILAAVKYSKSPTTKTRKNNEATSGLFMLVNYLSLIAAVAIVHGFHFA